MAHVRKEGANSTLRRREAKLHFERRNLGTRTPPPSIRALLHAVNTLSPATQSYPDMHPSFLGTERQWPCGSTELPAQAPNPQERDA